MDIGDELLNCRLCANSLDRKKKIPVFKSINDDNEISELCEIIYSMLGIHILKTDDLPKVICKKCDFTIYNMQDFKKKCHQADQKLRKKFISDINLQQCNDVDVKVKIESDEEIHETCPIELVTVSLESDIKIEDQNYSDTSDTKIEDNSIVKSTSIGDKLDHIKSKQNIKSKEEQRNKGRVAIEVGRKRNSERKLNVCEICGVVSQTLTRHMSVHFKNRFNCSKCPNTYSHKGALARHLLTHSDKKFLCEYCELTFSCQSYLTKHLKVHTGERNHICDICKKAFQTKYNLQTHIRIHTKEKPFKCEKCELAFAHRATFNIHSRECKNI